MGPYLPNLIRIKILKNNPGFKTDRHCHHFVHAGLIIRGILTIEFDGQIVVDLRPGDFFSIAPRHRHIVSVTHGREVESLDLRLHCFQANAPGASFRLPGAHGAAVLARESFIISSGLMRTSRPLLDAIMRFANTSTVCKHYANTLLAEFMDRIIRLRRRTFHRRATAKLMPQAVINALDLIHQSYRAPLPLVEMAKQGRVSVSHLRGLFKRAIGITPHRYLIKHRVEMAKRLLSGANPEIKEVAFQTGFSDAAQMTRTFSRLEGYTPGVYRTLRDI